MSTIDGRGKLAVGKNLINKLIYSLLQWAWSGCG